MYTMKQTLNEITLWLVYKSALKGRPTASITFRNQQSGTQLIVSHSSLGQQTFHFLEYAFQAWEVDYTNEPVYIY